MAPDVWRCGPRPAGGRRASARRDVLIACAGALVLALVVARLASILLAGTGSPRAGRSPSDRRPGSPPAGARGLASRPPSGGSAPPAGARGLASVPPSGGSAPPAGARGLASAAPSGGSAPPAGVRGLASVPPSGGSAPPAGRLTVVPSVTPGPTGLRAVGRAGSGASDRPAPTRLPARSAPTRPSDRPAPTRLPARSAPTRPSDRPVPTRRPAGSAPTRPANRPAPAEPSPVQIRPVRPEPSPRKHRPARPDVSFAVEREFGFER